jgi:excisionase family DNA binding protein
MKIEHRKMTQSYQQLELLKIEQVADILSISIKTARRLIERGELRSHRIGKAIRVSREDLRAYLNATRC